MIWLLFAIASLFSFSSAFSLDIYQAQSLLSHTEGSGIGYKRGYTTLETFISFEQDCAASLYPFIEIQGHGFDNIKLAGNFGIGLRYVSETSWIFGASLWYDLRQGDHRGFDEVGRCYHQAGLSLEAIGPKLDFRFNLYQPVGKKEWTFTQIHFNDHKGITPIPSRKKQSTFTGFDAEMGGYIASGSFYQCIDWKTYFALGPYLIKQPSHSEKWGVKVRLCTDLTKNWSLELKMSYDQQYLGSCQVKIAFNFPLYPTSSIKNDACCGKDPFRQIINQPVRRVDIMPLRTRSL